VPSASRTRASRAKRLACAVLPDGKGPREVAPKARASGPQNEEESMKRAHGFFAAALVAFVLAAGSACSTTQSAGQQVDDSSIHTSIKAKLAADRFSNLVNVDVNVTNGVVTMAGEVPNAKVKAEAEEEARSVKGVTKVVNNLQVKSPPTP